MGLDMYLTKRTYVGAEYKHRNVTGICEIFADGKKLNIDFNKISYIEERAGYWRKANQVHRWFVANVQDGEDDCKDYDVSEAQLIDLLNICEQIKKECPLIDGNVRNGQIATKETGGKFVDVIEQGKLMKNSHVAAKLLPSASGFFFGSTDYDQYYIDDIDNTIEIISELLKAKGTEKYLPFEVSYRASW